MFEIYGFWIYGFCFYYLVFSIKWYCVLWLRVGREKHHFIISKKGNNYMIFTLLRDLFSLIIWDKRDYRKLQLLCQIIMSIIIYMKNIWFIQKYLFGKKLVMSRKFVKNSFGEKIMIRLQINSRGFINCTRQWKNPLDSILTKNQKCLSYLVIFTFF